MLGEVALDLIRESGAQNDLGPFNEDSAKKVLQEMKNLYEENHREIQEKQKISGAIHLRHAALERNKRCLLAYVYHRANKTSQMRWEFGPVLPPEIKQNLAEPERKFFQEYNKDLAGYMRNINLDLTTDVIPPKSLFIQVRVIKDYGEMETDDGEIILLKKNTQHFLPRSQCEQLIRQGILEHVSP